MKIVIHVDETKKWSLATKNALNLIKIDPSIKIIIVANSEAVEYFFDSESRYIPAIDYHVCHQSIMHRELDTQNIHKVAQIVQSGVYDIALLQTQGYLYIKP